MNGLPDLTFGLPPDLAAIATAARSQDEFAAEYFMFIHPWLPFLSRKIFMEKILNPLSPMRPTSMLLIVSMKLITIRPSATNDSTSLYHRLKESILQLESASILDFRAFQALILLALYEFGHGKYPQAFLTVGYCLRYGIALGINMELLRNGRQSLNAVESEEKRRSWWALIILER